GRRPAPEYRCRAPARAARAGRRTASPRRGTTRRSRRRGPPVAASGFAARKAGAPPCGGAPEREYACGGQADLSLTSTLSLSRPVTGNLFCFWYDRRALRVSAFITPLTLPL